MCHYASGFRDKRWGIACKVVHTNNIKTYFETCLKGVAQIESSDADCGFVSVNLKNILPHDEIFQITTSDPETTFTTYPSTNIPAQRLRDFCSERTQQLVAEISQIELLAAFENKKALPYILHFVQSLTGLRTGDVPFLCPLTFLHVTEIEKLFSEFIEMIATLNKSAQNL